MHITIKNADEMRAMDMAAATLYALQLNARHGVTTPEVKREIAQDCYAAAANFLEERRKLAAPPADG